MKKTTVFLGGTCNNDIWRDELIPMFSELVDAFNPVVKDWTPECQEIEKEKRKTCDIVIYVITPNMTGIYSIAEAVQDSNVRPEKTIFAFINNENKFTEHQRKSLIATGELIQENGAIFALSLQGIATIINSIAAKNISTNYESKI